MISLDSVSPVQVKTKIKCIFFKKNIYLKLAHILTCKQKKNADPLKSGLNHNPKEN